MRVIPPCNDALRRMDALVISDALLDQLSRVNRISHVSGKFEAALKMLQKCLGED